MFAMRIVGPLDEHLSERGTLLVAVHDPEQIVVIGDAGGRELDGLEPLERGHLSCLALGRDPHLFGVGRLDAERSPKQLE